MRKFLENIINAKKAKAAELRAAIEKSEDVTEVRALGTTLQSVLDELRQAEEQLANLDEPAGEGATADEGRALFSVATMQTRNAGTSDNGIEARLAFARYVTRGELTPEMRADAITNTSGVATAIPENLVHRIIESIDAFGMILPLVTRTAYPVGQTIPVDAAKPTASWVNEGASSDAQAKTGYGSIVFGAFKLRCEIRMTQEVSVQTIPAFEALFVKQVAEAMVKAIEAKIVSADAGASSPAGILYRASGTDNTVEIAKLATGTLTYKVLCDAEAALPQQYEGGAKWFMSKRTFMQFIAMTDEAGQPVARVNYGIGGKPERTLLGRDVVLTGTYLPDYVETALTADSVFAFLFDPADYVLNTSYDLGIQRKHDWDTEDHCVKAVMSVDGKVIDRGSLVKLVKKYN